MAQFPGREIQDWFFIARSFLTGGQFDSIAIIHSIREDDECHPVYLFGILTLTWCGD